MSGGRARGMLLPLVVAGVLAGGALLYPLAFPPRVALIQTPAIATLHVPDASPPPSPAFEVVAIEGLAQVGAGDTWRPIVQGERLYPGETIATSEGGRAVLRSAGGDELILRERVALEVTTLSRTLTELTLTRGRVRAAPAASTERFAISAGTARAEGPGGSRFTVYTDETGIAVVATDEGAVRVLGDGREVVVEARRQTVVPPGGRPRDPFRIPDQVFLSVTWPEGKVLGSRAVVHGLAAPGTEVRVNGAPAAVRADGGFSAPVQLRDGPNRVEVRAEDITGRERTVRGTVNARTSGPPLEADPSGLYADPPPAPR